MKRIEHGFSFTPIWAIHTGAFWHVPSAGVHISPQSERQIVDSLHPNTVIQSVPSVLANYYGTPLSSNRVFRIAFEGSGVKRIPIR